MQCEAARSILEAEKDLAGKAVPAQRIHGKRNGCARARVDCGRNDSQFEIRTRCADAQPVTVIRSAGVLRIAESHVTDAFRRHRERHARVGVMRVEAEALVLVIVVEGEALPAGAHDFEDRIERRTKASRHHLRHECAFRGAFDPKNIHVSAASDATVDASVNGAIMSGEDAARAVRLAIGDTGTATVARREGTNDAW